ncbi:hypothetical protein EJ04DRAFT_518125 [Polyplosphaeria fusca]|uniref:BZIP domain-containing protein n=1 Tax=Polyplosphaeria fusca TaxID=682080 RepID=A0A9P4V7H3_9PLEO|nr:hypothetical protein EJ04DRAFT_518125 [Polyplosphaeria fusca]
MADPKESLSDSKEKDNAQYLKRREQVRRAQRTHRERKEAYIKSLEGEVLQLRTNEAKILQETRNLHSEIGRLRSILDQNGIPHALPQGFVLPSHPPSESSGPPSLSSVSILSNPHQQQQLHIGGPGSQFYLSDSDGSPPSGGTAESSRGLRRKLSFFKGRGRSESDSQDGSSSASGHLQPSPAADISTIAQSASNMSLRDMDQTSLGMEFVLTLEAPCLHHTQGEANHTHLDPTGHALTMTAPLLFQNPHQQPVDTSSSKQRAWETPHIGLEKLLSLSSNFELADELTPVQAWHQIRTHPDFEGVPVPHLKRFTEDMLKHVKCYGYEDNFSLNSTSCSGDEFLSDFG